MATAEPRLWDDVGRVGVLTTTEPPASALLPIPVRGRTYTTTRVVQLGDADESGELRLDAAARFLQDIASDDAVDGGLENAFGWLVRRTLIEVRSPATHRESVSLTTFCSGHGRCWAERRTSITGDAGASIEAASLWIHIDIDKAMPAKLTDDFFDIWGDAAGGRKVTSRHQVDSPDSYETSMPWPVRRSDLDQLGHMNNANHWQAIEEYLTSTGTSRVGRFELDYHDPIAPDADVHLSWSDDRIALTSTDLTYAIGRATPLG